MAASKKKIVETFSQVSGIGPAYAEQLYDEFGLRSLADLIAAGEKGELQKLRGIGPAKEKSITKSATELLSNSEKTDAAPEKKSSGKAKKGGAKAKKGGAKAKKDDAKKAKKDSKKAATPEAKAKKEEPKKAEAPKKEAPKKAEAPKKETPKKEPPKRHRASDFEDRAKESKSKPGKRPTIPGLLFKIGKKLVSRLISS
jgi:Holliday junction resolvasome RuvABC DNA-binding subunit